jgi:hypothetical protein
VRTDTFSWDLRNRECDQRIYKTYEFKRPNFRAKNNRLLPVFILFPIVLPLMILPLLESRRSRPPPADLPQAEKSHVTVHSLQSTVHVSGFIFHVSVLRPLFSVFRPLSTAHTSTTRYAQDTKNLAKLRDLCAFVFNLNYSADHHSAKNLPRTRVLDRIFRKMHGCAH